MGKLSLNKSAKKEEDIPLTQDVFNREPFDDENIDLSMPVTKITETPKKEEDKTDDDFTNTVSSTIKEIRREMDTRLAFAKAREGLAYGLDDTGNLPPFCRINIWCRPTLNERAISDEIKDMWQKKEKSLRESLIKETVEFLDVKLTDINTSITQRLDNAKAVIGVATKSAGEARKQLMRRFMDIKDSNERELNEFKTDIRSKRDNHGWRRGNIHRFKFKGLRRNKTY